VDFSSYSATALEWAARAAAAWGAPLEILHVVHDPASHPGYYGESGTPAERIEDAAERQMEEFLARAASEAPELGLDSARTRLVVGLPVTRILEVAEADRAQLIVMGSQGRTGLPHLMLGSKAEQVVRLSSIPVTIVKAPENSRKTG
jgi:nucleotide-binding universal stress UspA family protein